MAALTDLTLADLAAAMATKQASAVAQKRKWRQDAVTDGGQAAKLLANAPEKEDGFFVVPKVVE